jgi:hypothetical protein
METISYFVSCIACFLLGGCIALLLLLRKAEPTPRHHQVVMLDIHAKEELEQRVGPVSLPQAINFLRFEDERDCLLFAVPMEYPEVSEEIPEQEHQQHIWQHLRELVANGDFERYDDIRGLTEPTDEHTSEGGEA